MDFQLLIDAAKQKLGFRQLSQFAEAGSVAAALATADGQIYTGICIDTSCSMGFCAEQAAAAQMITDGQQRVLQMVAINSAGEPIPPCGRCREFISQLDPANHNTQVMFAAGKIMTIEELLPFDWKASK